MTKWGPASYKGRAITTHHTLWKKAISDGEKREFAEKYARRLLEQYPEAESVVINLEPISASRDGTTTAVSNIVQYTVVKG